MFFVLLQLWAANSSLLMDLMGSSNVVLKVLWVSLGSARNAFTFKKSQKSTVLVAGLAIRCGGEELSLFNRAVFFSSQWRTAAAM